MRYIITTIMAIFLATPVFAGSTICNINGPHNCAEQNEDQLIALTQSTIHKEQLIQEQHPFKTENDVILEAASTQHADLGIINNSTSYLSWRK